MSSSETERETTVSQGSSDFSGPEIETSKRLLESTESDASNKSTDPTNKSTDLATKDARQTGQNSTLPELTVGNANSSGADKGVNEKKQSELAAGRILSGENSTDMQIQRMCNKNISDLVSNLVPGSSQNLLKQSAIATSLANAEKVGGPALLQNVIDATNSNLWLDGSKNRLRQNPLDPANPQERGFEVYNQATNKTVHSLNFSVLPEAGRSGEKQELTKPDPKEAEKEKGMKSKPSWRRSYR